MMPPNVSPRPTLAAALLLLSIASVAVLAQAPPQITNLSPVTGSIHGGTRLTINGDGFGMVPSRNSVYIGDALVGGFCDVIDYYSTDTKLVCTTPRLDSRARFLVSVQTATGAFAECNARHSGCFFTYTFDATPVTERLSPERLLAPDAVTVIGSNFRLGDRSPAHNDFLMTIGANGDRCNVQSETFNERSFACEAIAVEPGIQPVAVTLGARGNADASNLILQVVPTIEAIYPSEGSVAGGQEVTIEGSGFSSTPSDNEVWVHGARCIPTKASAGAIECVSTPHPDTTATAPAAPNGNDEPNLILAAHWPSGVDDGNIADLVGRDFYTAAPVSRTVAGRFGQSHFEPCVGECATRFTTWFVPNATGEHRFYLSASGVAELWLSADEMEVPYAADPASETFNDRRIASQPWGSSNFESFASQRSEVLTLERNKKYWFRGIVKSGSTPRLNVRVELPSAAGGRVNVTNDFSGLVTLLPSASQPIAVLSRGIPAVCGRKCTKSPPRFEFTAAGTPVITAVSPTSIASGTSVTFSGRGFTTPGRFGASVNVGGAVCAITTISDTQIVCTMAGVVAGSFEPEVLFSDFGRAIGNGVTLQASMSITSVTPGSGSRFGSSAIDILGVGFGTEKSVLTVRVCNSNCAVQSVSNTRITCITSLIATAQTCDVTVTSTIAETRAIFGGFAFLEASSNAASFITQHRLTPTEGSVEGGFLIEGLLAVSAVLRTPADLSVSLVNLATGAATPCPVSYVFDKKFTCLVPAHPPGTVNVTASISASPATAVVVGSLTFFNEIVGLGQNGFGPQGGNIADIYYRVWNPNPLTAFDVKIGGVPCAQTEVVANDNRIRCFAAATASTSALPKLDEYDFVGGNTTHTLWTSNTARTGGGVVVAPGGLLMTKRKYNAPIAVTAVIRPSRAFDTSSTADDFCIRMRALAADGSSTGTGYEAYVGTRNGGRMGIRIGNWAPGGVVQFDDEAGTGSIGLNPNADMTLRLEVRFSEVALYINGVLIERFDTNSFRVGSVGFNNGCQEFVVRSLTVEDLSPRAVTVTHNGVALRNTRFDVTWVAAPSVRFTSISASRLTPGETFTFALSSTNVATWTLGFYLLPRRTPASNEWTADAIDLCSSIWFTEDPPTYRCRVRTDSIPGGSFTLRLRTAYGGFFAESYDVVIAPLITNVWPAEIGAGIVARVQLQGSGFPLAGAGLSVTVGSSPCTVESSSLRTLTCTVTVPSATTAAAISATIDSASSRCESGATCSVVVGSKAPTVTTVSPSTITHIRQRITIRGTDLSRAGSVLIGSSSRCAVVWGSETHIECEVLPGFSEPAGTATLTVFAEFGRAAGSPTIAVASPQSIGRVEPSRGAAGTRLRLWGLNIAPTASFTAATIPNEWIGAPHTRSRTCAAISGTGVAVWTGFYGRADRLTKSVAGLAAHTAIGIRARVLLLSGWWGQRFTVTIDGVPHVFDRNSFAGVQDVCGDSSADNLLTIDLAVGHSAATATIDLEGEGTWALGDFSVLIGSVPAAPTVDSVACTGASFRRDEVRCDGAPAQTPTAAVPVAFGGQSCGEACMFTYSASGAPSVTNVFVGTQDALLTQFVTRDTVVMTSPNSLARPFVNGVTSNWQSGSATGLRTFSRSEFRALSFAFDEAGARGRCRVMFGLTPAADVTSTYEDIDFAFYLDGNNIQVFEHGSGMRWLGEVAQGSVFHIACADASCSTIHYRIGRRTVYVSTATPLFPLRLRASIETPHCGVRDIAVSTAANAASSEAGNVPVYIGGTGLAGSSLVARINGVAATARFITASVAVVVVPSSALTTLPLNVDVTTPEAGTSATATLTPAPFITRALHARGSSSGNHAQVVFGAGLTSVASVAGCASITARSEAQLNCLTAGDASGNVTITMTATTTSQTAVACVGAACPSYQLTSTVAATVDPISTPLNGLAVLNVTGQNFAAGTFPSLVIGDNVCLATAPATATSFPCRFASRHIVADSYSAAHVRSDRDGGSQLVSVVVPVTITDTAPVTRGTAGGEFTLRGTGFGSGASTNVASIVDSTGASVCSAITRNNLELRCTIGSLANPQEPFTLRIGAASVTVTHVTIDPSNNPSVTSVSPAAIGSNDILTLTGSNLWGLTAITVGGVPCAIVGSVGANSIGCVVSGALGAGSHAIAVVPQSALTSVLTVTSRLSVLSVTPSRAAISPNSNTDIVIEASGLDHATRTYVAFVGENRCPVVATTATSVTCRLTAPVVSSTRAVSVRLSVAGNVAATLPNSFVYDDPSSVTVTGIAPSSGTAAGGTAVTLTGTNFHFNFQFNIVEIGGSRCQTESVNTALTQLICITSPSAVNAAAEVKLTILGRGEATIPTPLTYNYVLAVNALRTSASNGPSVAVSAEGGVVLTIAGAGFVQSEQLFVTVGGAACPVLNLSATEITCQLPPAPRPVVPPRRLQTTPLPELKIGYTRRDGGIALVGIVINGVSAAVAAGAHVEYQTAPMAVVTSVAPSGIVSNGAQLTVSGVGFRTTGNQVIMTHIASRTREPCAIVSESATQIVCTVNVMRKGKTLVNVVAPGFGFAHANVTCTPGHIMACDGSCLMDAHVGPMHGHGACSRADWGRFGCQDIANLIAGDTFCHANGGTDKVGIPMVLDDGFPFNLNCPMYGCEGGDCNTTVSIQGSTTRVSTCGLDPNGFIVDVRASVTAFTPTTSSIAGGQRLTISGVDLQLDPTHPHIEIYLVPYSAMMAGDANAAATMNHNHDGNAHVGHSQSATGVAGHICVPLFNDASGRLICETTASAPGEHVLLVRVMGIEANCPQCRAQNITYVAATSPAITSLNTSSSPTAPVSLTINGRGFASAAEGNIVTVGGEPCAVTSSSSTRVVCTVPNLRGSSTSYPLALRVESIGLAVIEDARNAVLRIRPQVLAVSPARASTAGGTLVTLTGFGFAADARVRFGGCGTSETISSANPGVLVVRAASCSGSQSPRIIQSGETTSTCTIATGGSCSVDFNSEVTPRVTSATVDNGVLSLAGTFLSSTQSDASVTFSGQPCAILTYSDTALTCTVPNTLAAGSHRSTLLIATFGFASGSSATITRDLVVNTVSASEGSAGGRQLLTINGQGFGFDAAAIRVIVAGVPCAVTTAGGNTLQCRTSTAPPGTSGNVTVAVGTVAPVAAASVTYTYRQLATVTAIQPDRGSTAGGTMLTISGSGLSKQLSVTIDGVACTQSALEQQMTDAASPAGSKLYCTTGPHATMLEPTDLFVEDATSGAALPLPTRAAGQYQYVDLWSRRTTWGNNPPPLEMQSIVISKGQTVMLDISPPRLHLVLVFEGHLIFDYTKDIVLECTYIMVNFGRLTVGTWEKPFYRKATIRLYGDRLTPEIPNMGAKTIGMMMGVIDIHGVPRQPTWTRLAATAVAGATTIAVRGPVDWVVGEEIVVSSTDFEMLHAEQRRIIAVANGAANVVTLTLDRPLRWEHFGVRQCYGEAPNQACIDEIAEVGLLSRNVVIEGDKDSWKNNIGAQTIMMPMENKPTTYGRITYTEIRDCGQKFALGRYPVHFHGSGLSNYSWIIGNAVHHSMNRAFTIHGVYNVTYAENVVYDTFGHSFFVESGNEMYNTLRRNLVMVTRACTSCLNQDLSPANYWITNPNNYFYDNVAAGSLFYGFWFALFEKATQDDHHGERPVGAPTEMCPFRMGIGAFEGNTAHSNGNYGLNIKPDWLPSSNPFGCGGGGARGSVLRRFTTYKNGVHGVNYNANAGSVMIEDLIVADIGTLELEASGIWMEEESAGNATLGVRNALFFAFTGNQPYHRGLIRRGINLPRSDNYFIDNVTFVNYVNENWGVEPFRRQQRMRLNYQWGWQHTFRAVRFINSPQRVLLRFQHHAILHDEDGTLSGVAGARIVPQTPIFSNFSCTPLPDFASWWPVVRCEPSYVIRRMGMGFIYDSGSDMLWTIGGRSEIVYNLATKTVVTVPINSEASIEFTGFEGPNNWMTRFSPRFMLSHERMLLKVLYREYRYSVNASFDGQQNIRAADPQLTDAVSAARWNPDTRVITALLARPTTQVDFAAYRCPPEGCLGPAAPPPVDKPCEPYGRASTWTSGSVPADNADVHITFQDSVCLDSSTPGWPNVRFSSLLVEGRLHLFDDFCSAAANATTPIRIFIDRFIHVHGGELLIGNETNPIGTGCANVEVIISEVSFDDLEERRRKTLGPWGSRSIALEFGTLGIFGRPFQSKANLAASAAVGATTLVLDRSVDWRVGSFIGISATTRTRIYTFGAERAEESEEAQITAIATDGRTLTLARALTFPHYGGPSESVNGTVLHPGAEVVLLSRAVTIHGGHVDGVVPSDHGWQLNIGCTPIIHEGCAGPSVDEATGFPMSLLRPGLVQIQGATLRDIGQRGRRHGGVEVDGLRGDGQRPSFFRNSVMWHAMNTGFSLRHTSEPLELNDNVIFHVFGDGVRAASAGNVIVGNTAVMGTIPFGHCDNVYMPEMQACRPALFRVSHSNTVRNNIAASGVGAGFITEGDDCDSVERWSGNVARSTRDGLLVYDHPADAHFFWPTKTFRCRRVGGISSFFVADTGVAVWYAVGDVRVSDITVVDTSLGLTAIIVDTDVDVGLREPRYHVTNARFKSYFAGFACRDFYYRCRMTKFNNEFWCETFHGPASPPLVGNVGLLEAVFVTPEYTGRTLGERYFFWFEPDSYHTTRGKALINDVFFDGFDGMDSCQRKNVALYNSFVSNDTVHQHIFSNVRWGSGVVNGGEYYARTAYGYVPNNHMTYGNRTVFMDFDNQFHGGYWPDAPNKVWFVDADGSFTRTGVMTHILSSQTITRQSTWATTGWNGVTNVDAIGPVRENCTYLAPWNAFTCTRSYQFISLVIQNTGRDRLERRPAPLVLCKGDGMIVANGDPICQGGIVDYASGPFPKSKGHRTTLQRMSRFRFTVENGGNYTLLYRGTPPEASRFQLTNWEYLGISPDQVGIVINTRIWGGNAHSRLTVAVNGRREFPVFGYGYPHEYGLQWPAPLDRPGTHYHDRYIEPLFHRNVFSFTVRPLVVLDLAHENIVQVSMTLALPMDAFFMQKDLFVASFISLMGIPESSVRFARIVPGTVRRRQGVSSTVVGVEIDSGSDAPALSESATVALANRVQSANISVLASALGVAITDFSAAAIVTRLEEQPIRVRDGTAFVIVEASHSVAFSQPTVAEAAATFVATERIRPLHETATTTTVVTANVFIRNDNATRFTLSCAFEVEELSDEGINTACAELLHASLRDGRLAIANYTFANVTFVQNGAVSSDGGSSGNELAALETAVVIAIVVVVVVVVLLSIALVCLARKFCCSSGSAGAQQSAKVHPADGAVEVVAKAPPTPVPQPGEGSSNAHPASNDVLEDDV